VPPHFQRLLDSLLAAGAGTAIQSTSDIEAGAGAGEDVPAASLTLPDGETVTPVSAALMLLQMLVEYVRLAQRLPSLGSDAVGLFMLNPGFLPIA
jgi:hypothetical protein